MSRKSTPLDVWKYVDTKNGDKTICWPWTGGTSGTGDGRPVWWLDGRRVVPTRVIYELFNHPIPKGMQVRHTCDNHMCCNPYHLEIGTRAQNADDIYVRDRAGTPVAILREIRRLLATTQYSDQAIADFIAYKFYYKITREAIRNIKLGYRRAQGGEKTQEEIVAETLNIDLTNVHSPANIDEDKGEHDNGQDTS